MDLPLVAFPKAFVRPAPAPAASASSPEPDPRPRPGLSKVDVEVGRSHGIPVARIIDADTGIVISQTPPEQVLDVVAGLIEVIQRRERAGGWR